MISLIAVHTSVWEGCWVKREKFDVATRSGTPKPSCQSHNRRQLWPRSGSSKEVHTRTKDSEYWANIQKRHQINTKKLLKIEKEIVHEVVRGDKHNLRKFANCKAQISTMFGVDIDLCVAICKFFLGCVCHLEQLHAQSPFLFPIVFGINFLWMICVWTGVFGPHYAYQRPAVVWVPRSTAAYLGIKWETRNERRERERERERHTYIHTDIHTYRERERERERERRREGINILSVEPLSIRPTRRWDVAKQWSNCGRAQIQLSGLTRV